MSSKQHQLNSCFVIRGVLLTVLSVIVVLVPSKAEATWYSEGVEPGADIVMMDLRWPWWPSGTYYANWNTSILSQQGKISFYAGFVGRLPDGPNATPNPDPKAQDAHRPGSVWSFWGGAEDGEPVRFVDSAPNLSFKNAYGGEGANASLRSEEWDLVRRQQWYTMLTRIWEPMDPQADHSFIGRWIKDVKNDRWQMIGIARLPVRATSLNSNSGFIETLSDVRVVRPLDRRFGYFRKDGDWRKSDIVSINKTRYVVLNVIPEGDHEYIGIEYASKPDHLPQQLKGEPIPGNEKVVVRMKQPDKPTLDQPQVTRVQAVTTGQQVAVSWEVPAGSSPAFGYRIEVFDNPQCTGDPIAVTSERLPSARRAIVDAAVANPTVRFTLIDVFDQETKPMAVSAQPVELTAASPSPETTLPGLSFQVFKSPQRDPSSHALGPDGRSVNPRGAAYWQKLDELGNGTLVRQGLARGLDTSVRETLDAGYALVYKGLLQVPKDGVYIFYGNVDGAYRIRIGDQNVVVRDHQAGTTEHAGLCRLSKGDHSIEVTLLYSKLLGKNFEIDWEGPGLSRQPLTVQSLRVTDDGSRPKPTIQTHARGDGTGRVTVKVDPRGHDIDESAIYLGRYQLASAPGSEVEYDGPLSEGKQQFWCRVRYDRNHSVDLALGSLEVTGKPLRAGWTQRNLGEENALSGLWQTGRGAFSFFGNGMHAVVREVTGDFTATCRIDHHSREGVNWRAWSGIAAFEKTDEKNWEWGQMFYLVKTARNGTKSSPDSADLGGSRLSSYVFPPDHPWLRIVRSGNIWTAWTSADGKHWEIGGSHYKRAPQTMQVGLFVSAIQQDASAYYTAEVSELSIQPGLQPESTPPPAIAAKSTEGDRLTSVVMARSNPDIVVVRSTHAGLMRTTDGGKTWAATNGKLSDAANAVRSIAIHPENPEVMLRAAGRVSDGQWAGGLWKTTNGGASWTKLNFPGDFDGEGPSALCGEVLAFDLRDPDIIYSGSESKGLFKSSDGGLTWSSLGLVGERVTSVVVWPWEYANPVAARDMSHVCVTTCPDRWMPLLGRGRPSIRTLNETATSYVMRGESAPPSVYHERKDLGFYNVAFDRMCQSPNKMRYATSHGLQHNVRDDMVAFPQSKNVEWMRPFTAVASAALSQGKRARIITQPLDPEKPGRFSVSESWAFQWKWLDPEGDIPAGGLIAIAAEHRQGKNWWLLHTDGLFFSSNGARQLKKVLTAAGRVPEPQNTNQFNAHSTTNEREAHYDVQKDCAGAWKNEKATGSWAIEAKRAGTDSITFTQAAEKRSVSSGYDILNGRAKQDIRRRYTFYNVSTSIIFKSIFPVVCIDYDSLRIVFL